MRLWYLLNITDRHTRFLSCFRISNRILCFLFGLAQFLVVFASLFQHIYSWTKFGHVFKCTSNISTDATVEQRLLAYDLVIFDFGLMHRILKMSKCVANYLDGGYLRFSWCVEHSTALLILLVVLIFPLKRIWLFWPALFMQSTYVLGMAILTMATTPKMLEALSEPADRALGIAFCIYIGGVLLNWLFTLVLWHYYWAEEADSTQNRRANGNNDVGEERNTTAQRKRGMEVWMSST
ncbi:hypothetical protein GPALN_006917 [Globodera pallida]|nr:hypothetical protein GPALN_006917 [Globodera pallida]